jgi:D-sedoheptulose 7-phosphate isomerase
MSVINQILTELQEAQKVLEAFISSDSPKKIEEAIEVMARCLASKGKILSCGNGGSMCDAMHFAEELSGRFRDDRPALAAISISDPSHMSCVANDYGYAQIFSRYVEAVGREGDILLAISTSGNSENIIQAIDAAKKNGLIVVGLTGKEGGKMAEMCDIEIRAPFSMYADRVQEIHIKVIHNLILGIERKLGY